MTTLKKELTDGFNMLNQSVNEGGTEAWLQRPELSIRSTSTLMSLGGIFRFHWQGGVHPSSEAGKSWSRKLTSSLLHCKFFTPATAIARKQWRNHNRKEIHGLSFHSDRRGFNFAPPAIDLAVGLDACVTRGRLPMHQAPAV